MIDFQNYSWLHKYDEDNRISASELGGAVADTFSLRYLLITEKPKLIRLIIQNMNTLISPKIGRQFAYKEDKKMNCDDIIVIVFYPRYQIFIEYKNENYTPVFSYAEHFLFHISFVFAVRELMGKGEDHVYQFNHNLKGLLCPSVIPVLRAFLSGKANFQENEIVT